MLPSLLRSLRLLSVGQRVPAAAQVRLISKDVRVPKPGVGIQYQYRVKLPEKYTIRRLPIQKLAGRDPATGRVVVGTVGGGSKRKYRWVDVRRPPLEDGSPRQERVLQTLYDPLRTCTIALVAHGEHIRYVIAHEGMRAGDIITTYGDIPRIPVRPRIGDAHPLGALPAGTEVFNVEKYLGEEDRMCVAGGTFCTVLRRVGDRVLLQMPSKRQFSLRQECTAVVGRVSMRTPSIRPIGSAQRLRHLGYRPRSGLWQRKTGRFGRKVRRPPPLRELDAPPPPPAEVQRLTLHDVHVHNSEDTAKLFRPLRGMTN
ncbi:39S ribosomal protein L2, mitochondrial-like [Pollicipes pollicipes]|uniref:39S ribosomal protein L2, mitochondrial-like n=1 Tax=Pollicipes pollicipes TaxID=41117 RepID=UPI0018854E56|nr:39S ribosomal protein L2, mitochondrial-like [Pollicipes pollicipes]XP_037077564.1 39S ribosomal protein L2, mitochondrial-like [Pollicipes pollicipes]XP_037077565.1 39S ribosomal protein L2, mitochondrial-like [Pollicipes pollicipes]